MESMEVESNGPEVFPRLKAAHPGGARHEVAHPAGARRKLLVLDLNGFLVDRVRGSQPIPGVVCDLREGGCSVYVRPHAKDFIIWCLARFDVGIWTSANAKNISGALAAVLPPDGRARLKFVWDQRHCTLAGSLRMPDVETKPVFLKLLSRLWRKCTPRGAHDASSTILLDDSIYKTAANPPHTSVHPTKWIATARDDTGLAAGGDLRQLLAAVLCETTADVREVLARAALEWPALVPSAARRAAEIAQIAGLAQFCTTTQRHAAAPVRQPDWEARESSQKRMLSPPRPSPAAAVQDASPPLERQQDGKVAKSAKPPAATRVPAALGSVGGISKEAKKAKARRMKKRERRDAARGGSGPDHPVTSSHSPWKPAILL